MTGRRPPAATAARQAPTANAAAGAMPALQPAPLARRLAAVVYESLLLSALLLIAGFVLAPVVSPIPTTVVQGTLPIPSLAARIVSFAIMFGVGALYFAWSWTGGRRTLPMKTWRIRLVMRDGRSAVTPGIALVRYCAAWVGPGLALVVYAALAPTGHARGALWLAAFNYAWAWVDPDLAFLHDRIAGTRIVDARGP